MALDVTTLTTEGRDLTTTSALRRLVLGATATSTAQDAHLADLIRRASRWAQTYLQQPLPNQPLLAQTYRETVAGYGRRNLLLSRTPVRAVLAVYDATDTGGTAQALLTSEFRIEDAEAGLISRDAGFAWTVPFQRRMGWPISGGDALPLDPAPTSGLEYKPWLADYIAGWTYDGLSTASPNWSTVQGTTSTERSLPEDLEQGVLFKAQAYYEGGDEIESEKLGDLETNYRSLGTDPNGRLVTRSALLLEPYRRID